VKWIKNNLILIIISSLLLVGLTWELFLADLIQPSLEVTSSDLSTHETPPDLLENPEEEQKDQHREKLYVDIKGEIYQPGVYLVSPDDRVIDVIQSAGGFTNDADENQINLAEKVYDEMVIYVPNQSDEVTIQLQSSQKEGQINLNRATQSELEGLPGIGAVKAASIIQYREENGPFGDISELKNISGIGDKTFEQLEEHIYVQ